MSDNELDAELLALAGDDSSSDEEETQDLHPKRESPSQAEQSVEDAHSPPRRGLATKSKARASKGSARKARRADSDEEGEA